MIKKYCWEVINKKRRGLAANLLSAALKMLSVPFGLAVKTKNFFYNKRIIKTVKAGTKVVSVGNITVGGTGKTQLIKYFAEILAKRGKKIAVICRSYSGRKKYLWVSDGKQILETVKDSGDEPYMLAEMLPGVRVGAARKREKLALSAQDCDIILLDDAFQYRKLRRGLDVVALSARVDYERVCYLPGGIFREGLSALKRADVVVITKAAGVESAALLKIIDMIHNRNKDAEIIIAEERIESFRAFGSGVVTAAENFKIKKGSVLSAIGSPEFFIGSLARAGISVTGEHLYPDHHSYSRGEIAAVAGSGACFITSKDEVKINKDFLAGLNVEMWVAQPSIVLKDTNGKVIEWPKKLERLL